MTARVADMTADELGAMIEALMDRKLAEWLGEPDAGLELREGLRERIQRQRDDYASGDRGVSIEELVQRYGED